VTGYGEWGTKALSVGISAVTGGLNYFYLLYQKTIPVDVNKTYAITAKVKTTSFTDLIAPANPFVSVAIGVACYDASFNLITTIVECNSIQIRHLHSYVALKGEITGEGISTIFRSGTTHVRPYVYISANFMTGTVVIDGLEFYEKDPGIQLEYNSGSPRLFVGSHTNYMRYDREGGLEIRGNILGSSYASATIGKRVEINVNNSNEIKAYGVIDNVIRRIASIGINEYNVDQVAAEFGTDTLTGYAVYGLVKTGSAIYGRSFGTGGGIRGYSAQGVGGRFEIGAGGQAQIQLASIPAGSSFPTPSENAGCFLTMYRGSTSNVTDLYYCDGTRWVGFAVSTMATPHKD
jgi:hypothetical protein